MFYIKNQVLFARSTYFCAAWLCQNRRALPKQPGSARSLEPPNLGKLGSGNPFPGKGSAPEPWQGFAPHREPPNLGKLGSGNPSHPASFKKLEQTFDRAVALLTNVLPKGKNYSFFIYIN